MITDAELAQLSDKSSRNREIVKLYREHDFLKAYGLHTDLRVKEEPHQAIGGLWDEYGALQRDFLIARGLRPNHRLLDLGCGTGRLARAIVPYLDACHYTGFDISMGALEYARQLSTVEGWADKSPDFVSSEGRVTASGFDFIWAFSVMIHLPSDIAASLIKFALSRLADGGRLFFSYVRTERPDNTRTGLKQFKHPLSFYQKVADELGCPLIEVPWPGRQRILEMSLR
jgi:SAM-dependent methyltransferase